MDKGVISLQCLIRSSIDSAKRNVANMIDSVFTLAGADISFEGEYPGWKPNDESKILKTLKPIFVEINGEEPHVEVIHAGLECGIIGARFQGMDMVSFGPTIKGAHSPDERVHVPAVRKFWEILVKTLESIS